MTALWIVETLDAVKDICHGFSSRFVNPPSIDSFDLQGREDALHGRVVPDLSSAAHVAVDSTLAFRTAGIS